MNLSIIVPCHRVHIKYIKNIIIGNISKQTLKPDEMIIVINPITNSYQNQIINYVFEELKKDYSSVKFIEIEEECTPGKARNIGFNNSNGDIIIYSDADDLYHPMRNEIVTRVFKDHNCDVVLHDYLLKEKDFLSKKIEYESILIARGVIDSDHETNMKPGDNNFKIVHGHASFKRGALKETKYNEELVPGADGEIIRRIKAKDKKIICIDSKLSSWFPSALWYRK